MRQKPYILAFSALHAQYVRLCFVVYCLEKKNNNTRLLFQRDRQDREHCVTGSHLDCPRYTLKTRSRWPPVANRVRSLRGDCEEF